MVRTVKQNSIVVRHISPAGDVTLVVDKKNAQTTRSDVGQPLTYGTLYSFQFYFSTNISYLRGFKMVRKAEQYSGAPYKSRQGRNIGKKETQKNVRPSLSNNIFIAQKMGACEKRGHPFFYHF